MHEPIRFESTVLFWDPDKGAGLAVAEVPPEHHAALGGLKQQKVRGHIGEAAFESNLVPAGGGRLALSVSKTMMKAARAAVGERVTIEITGVGRV